MSFCYWKADVFQHSRDDPVFVECDKYIKVSSSLIGLIVLDILTAFMGLENLCIVALILQFLGWRPRLERSACLGSCLANC